jgi:hypothetical protein
VADPFAVAEPVFPAVTIPAPTRARATAKAGA